MELAEKPENNQQIHFSPRASRNVLNKGTCYYLLIKYRANRDLRLFSPTVIAATVPTEQREIPLQSIIAVHTSRYYSSNFCDSVVT